MPSDSQIRAVQTQRLNFLNAIWDRELAGQRYPYANDVAQDVGMDGGDWDAIKRVTETLKADQLIDGSPTAEHGLVTVGLTGSGRRVVESKLAGHEPTGGSPASIGDVRVEGNQNVINIQQHSAGATQHVELTAFDKRKMLKWADDVNRRLASHGLADEEQIEVRNELDSLRNELSKHNPDPSSVHRIGKYVLRILASVPGSLASAGLIEVGKQLFS